MKTLTTFCLASLFSVNAFALTGNDATTKPDLYYLNQILKKLNC